MIFSSYEFTLKSNHCYYYLTLSLLQQRMTPKPWIFGVTSSFIDMMKQSLLFFFLKKFSDFFYRTVQFLEKIFHIGKKLFNIHTHPRSKFVQVFELFKIYVCRTARNWRCLYAPAKNCINYRFHDTIIRL